jgi:hypothetical protein
VQCKLPPAESGSLGEVCVWVLLQMDDIRQFMQPTPRPKLLHSKGLNSFEAGQEVL